MNVGAVPYPDCAAALRQPRGVKFLVSDQPAVSTQAGAWLGVTVPTILDHEVIAVDLG